MAGWHHRLDEDEFEQALGVGWRRQWRPTPVPLPGKSHGWRSIVGYSPWGHKELDTTVQLRFRLAFLSEQNRCSRRAGSI